MDAKNTEIVIELIWNCIKRGFPGNKKREEYLYTYEEVRRQRMGSFGGRHCR